MKGKAVLCCVCCSNPTFIIIYNIKERKFFPFFIFSLSAFEYILLFFFWTFQLDSTKHRRYMWYVCMSLFPCLSTNLNAKPRGKWKRHFIPIYFSMFQIISWLFFLHPTLLLFSTIWELLPCRFVKQMECNRILSSSFSSSLIFFIIIVHLCALFEHYIRWMQHIHSYVYNIVEEKFNFAAHKERFCSFDISALLICLHDGKKIVNDCANVQNVKKNECKLNSTFCSMSDCSLFTWLLRDCIHFVIF